MSASQRERTLRPDSKGRVTLGSLAAGTSGFKAHRDAKGRIILEPLVEVPASEAWLWKNEEAMKSVQRGLKESAQGKLVERGSFAHYAKSEK